MRQVSLIALFSVFTLLLGSCQIGNGDEDVAVNSVEPSPTASQTPTEAAPTATSTAPFNDPVTPERPENPVAVPDLLQTMSSDIVAQQAQKDSGRSDPFAAVPVKPVVTIPPEAARGSRNNAQPVAVLPQRARPQQLTKPQQNQSSAGAGSNTTSSANRSSSNNQASGNKKGSASTPSSSTSKKKDGADTPSSASTPTPEDKIAVAPFSPDLPTLPEPDQAKAVEVTGVIQVNGVTNAIVKVPNEPARYVKPGQRLSNGQVLVKRIEMSGGPVPIVILEQYGVEIARRVGDKPIGVPGEGSPTASLPMQKLARNTSPA